MPIRTTFFPEYCLGYREFIGELTVADLSRGYAEFQSAPQSAGVLHTIDDLRGLTAARMFPEGLAEFGRVIAEDMSRDVAPKNVVLLAPPKGHLGMAAEYARQINASGHGRCAVHFELAKALDWLGLPQAVLTCVTGRGRRLVDIDPDWTT